jgi:hypothetical protein
MAYLLMLTVMSSSVAMAAYVCPRDMHATPSAEMMSMEDCAGMDVDKPALCATQQSGAQFALEHLAAQPAMAPITVSSIAPVSLPRALSLPPDMALTTTFQLGTDPPYLRTQRVRI